MSSLTGWGRSTWGSGAWGQSAPVSVTGVEGTTALGSEEVTAVNALLTGWSRSTGGQVRGG